MSEDETKNEESTKEAPQAPDAPEAEAAPVADPDAKSGDVPELENQETPAEEEEDLSKLKGEEIAKPELNRHIRPGMVVRVHEIILDVTPSGEERRRVQVFEGTVLGLAGHGAGRTMTVRKVSKGYGVEKIYPLASPNIEKVEVLKQFMVRRAKLGFLRGVFKRNRVKTRFRRKMREVTD